MKHLEEQDIINRLYQLMGDLDEIDAELTSNYIGEYNLTPREEYLYDRRERLMIPFNELEDEIVSRGWYFDANDEEYKKGDKEKHRT